MLDLRLPLDVERLPEFRELALRLATRSGLQLTSPAAEALAFFVFFRLMIELGYLAQRTNKPGQLTAWGAAEYRRTLMGACPAPVDVVALLADGPAEVALLKRGEADDYFCELFAKYNAHLAGDHLEKHERGNINSAVSRRQPRLQVESVQQATLFGDTFTNLQGQPLVGQELNSAVIVIRNIDVSLLPLAVPRHTRSYTQGLMTDALKALAYAGAKHEGKALVKFYGYLAANQHNAALPKETEKILADFVTYYKAAGL